MNKARITSVLKGALCALGVMVIYAVPLGCFIALMLLVAAMEEGGESLPSVAMALTEAMVLLTQGTGFTIASVKMAIMPLLLTGLLIALIAQCLRHAGTTPYTWVSGLVVWVALNQICVTETSLQLHDSELVIAAKTAVIWLLGTAFALLPSSPLVAKMRQSWSERVPEPVRVIVRIMVRLTVSVLVLLALAGVITVLVWVVRGASSMGKVFDLLGMEGGSRVLTTLACLAWLPNFAIWAISWLMGAGFSIGDLGTFTMWVGQSVKLPPLPIFGLLPQPISVDSVRLAVQIGAPALFAVCALVAMLVGPMRVHVADFKSQDGARRLIALMIRDALMLCGTAIIVLIVCYAGFMLSSGSLGERHLAHVGVDVAKSVGAVGWNLRQGFICAWLAVAIITALIYGIHWIVVARGNAPSEISREEHDDERETSDQEGTGLGLS